MSNMSGSLKRLIDLLKENLGHIEVVISSRWSNSPWQVLAPLENLFEIDYALSGTLNLHYDGKDVACNPGDIILWDGTTLGVCKVGQFTYCYIIFKVRDDYDQKTQLLSDLHACFKDIIQIRCPWDQRHSIEQLYLDTSIEMLTELDNFELVTQLSVISLLIIIQRIVALSEGSTPFVKSRKNTDLVADIIKYLSNRLNQSHTLSELGRQYQSNPQYLNRVFKGTTGYSIIHYLLKMKIEKAKQLLLLTDMNQIDIALEIGMNSSQYFSYMFKRMVGVTPSQYRKQRGCNVLSPPGTDMDVAFLS